MKSLKAGGLYGTMVLGAEVREEENEQRKQANTVKSVQWPLL